MNENSVEYYRSINQEIRENFHAAMEADATLTAKDKEIIVRIFDAEFEKREVWNDGFSKGYEAGYKQATSDITQATTDGESL